MVEPVLHSETFPVGSVPKGWRELRRSEFGVTYATEYGAIVYLGNLNPTSLEWLGGRDVTEWAPLDNVSAPK